jgi:hypothetical protein
MEKIVKFYQYCDIQPFGTKTYLPLLNPTNINAKINTNVIETIYSEKLILPYDKPDKNKRKNKKNS